MEFLIWHYTSGLKNYLLRWRFIMGWVIHYFSLPILLPTLFSPWKRLIDDEEHPGFNWQRYFEKLSYNIISRCIGAIVRLTLFCVGLITLLPAFTAGLAGLIFWLLVPLIGLPNFLMRDKHTPEFFHALWSQMASEPTKAAPLLFATLPGKFFLEHLAVSPTQLLENFRSDRLEFKSVPPKDFAQLMQTWIKAEVWDENFLRKNHLDSSMLQNTAVWWDFLHSQAVADLEERNHYSRPGIGLELLFGYTPVLNQYSSDLSLPQSFSHHLIGRGELVSRIGRTLSGGFSVILVGLPGVGKRTIALEFAKRAAAGEVGAHLSYQRVLELDYQFLLSGALDLNTKKTRFSQLLAEATEAGNIVLVIKDIHRLIHSDVEGLDFTDILEKFLEKRTLKVIAITAQADYDRFIVPNTRLRKYFQTVEAQPATKEQALKILFDAASVWEKRKNFIITTPALHNILDSSDRYITETPFPEKALEILDQVIIYVSETKKTLVGSDDVNQIIKEITGISLTSLTSSERSQLANLEEILHRGLIGQDQAISLISKSLRAESVGARNDSRPIGSFLFLGPTGVGKTQTAKILAQVYYGSDKEILRFDMPEYATSEGALRLIGSIQQNLPGVLTTAIKNRPASLLLLDEIEKAPREIFNLFLTLLDEGFITDSFGKKIICRHLFVIATTNAAAEFIRRKVLDGISGSDLQKQVVEFVLSQQIFTPEFLNRFDAVVVFEPLSPDQVEKIAGLLLTDFQNNLKKQNIYLEITPQLTKAVAVAGFQPELGARPLRRVIDLTLGDLVGKSLLKEEIISGDRIRIIPDSTPDGFSLVKIS